MDEQTIKRGKRPKNPLNRRIWKDLRRDWKRYLMIFAMLVVTIGFVSGMYVSNNSMLHSLDDGVTKFHREDGHFRLSGKADADTLKGIASGEMADVPAMFRERAYEEADTEVEDAVRDAVTEEVEQQVKDAIRTQVEAAVDAQLAQAAAMGAPVTDADRESAVEEAYQTALDENYDKARSEALEQAFDSDDYQDALSDAIKEAHEEIDKEIDEKYQELSDRFNLDEKFDPVPVTIYELFYKDRDETIPGKSGYKGGIRVYAPREEIDLYDILDGRAPETENEIIIDRMHADNASIQIGDTLTVGKVDYTVVGLASFVDYTTLYEKNTDTMFDALTFDVAMVTAEGFDRIHANTRANYAFTYDNPPADAYEEKEMSDHFLKALITQTAISEKELEIEDYVPAYLNNAITFAPNDLGSDKAIGGVLLYVLIGVMAFIFAVTISTTLEQEASVIGTLRASGYTRGELLRYYMGTPLLVVLLAAVVGNILGYTVFKNVVVGMYYNSYSLPGYVTLWTPEAFIRTTIVPIVLMLVINFFVISSKLRLTPLQFLRHDLKKTRRKKAVRLPRFKFFGRFRLRVFLQNLPNYLMLFVGITFVMLLLSMAVGMPETLQFYQNRLPEMMFAEDQVILSDTKDEDGEPITTDAEGAERYAVTSLERQSDVYNEEISVYGVQPDSAYVTLDAAFFDTDDSEVYISQAYAEKFDVKAGDTIVLSEKYEHRDYTWKVYGIFDYSAGIAVFMDNAQFNRIFDKDEDYFSGYLSDVPITDIDEQYIAAEITSEDMTKLARQLDHSMGAYMLYFQYACMIVAAILLYLLTKIIIEKNERAISMVKILGYETGEIASLYLIPTALVVFFSEFLAMYLGYTLMSVFWKAMMMSLGGWFAFVMSAEGFVREFVLVFAAYLVISILDFLRIRRIPKVLALKNME